MNNSIAIKSLNNSIPEVSFDFTKNKIGDININLYFNQTLSDERMKLESNTQLYLNNILIVFIDSVSKANSQRQLKKIMKFFEKFMPYKGNNNPRFPSQNFHSFQFFKYHAHEFHTRGYYPVLFYGRYKNEIDK